MVKRSKTRTSSSHPGTSQETPDFSELSDIVTSSELNLANHFLIAMPSMLDPIFGGTVIYLCEHNADGALGVIINKPTDMTMEVLFDRIDLKLEIQPDHLPMTERPVMFGGPVQVDRGFVLHAPVAPFSSTLRITDEIALTTSKDILEAVATGKGPEKFLVSLGCAGWSAGQLEQEIIRNGWLTVRADPSIIFESPVAERFAAAVNLLGIDPMMLTGEAGHAWAGRVVETVLAFDFGLKRIGVAVGNSLIKQAQPLTVISAPTNDAKFASIAALMAEWQPACCVIGLPRHPDGMEHEMTVRCRRFANQMHGRFGVPTVLVDERYSSAVIPHQRGDLIDAQAAAIILQQYFDEYAQPKT